MFDRNSLVEKVNGMCDRTNKDRSDREEDITRLSERIRI
jgi:hypothetical protein